MKKIFTVAFMRDLEKQLNKGEISYSRMVEILNETANEAIKEANDEKEKLISVLWSERSDLKHRLSNEVWEGFVHSIDDSSPNVDFITAVLHKIPTMSVSEAEEALKSIADRNPKNERSLTIKEMDEAIKEAPEIRLRHIYNVTGVHVKTFKPTGKEETTIIRTDTGKEFSAPSDEFIRIEKPQ